MSWKLQRKLLERYLESLILLSVCLCFLGCETLHLRHLPSVESINAELEETTWIKKVEEEEEFEDEDEDLDFDEVESGDEQAPDSETDAAADPGEEGAADEAEEGPEGEEDEDDEEGAEGADEDDEATTKTKTKKTKKTKKNRYLRI